MKRFLLLLGVFFYSMVAHGVISYSLQQHENGHCALNVGDCHDKEMDQINEIHCNALVEIVEQCINPARPIKVYLEGSNSITKDYTIHDVKLLEVMRQALERFKGKKGFKFELYEPRKSESNLVNAHIVLLNELLYKGPNSIEKGGLLQFLRFKNGEQIKKDDSLSISSYLKTLDRDEQRLRKWRDKYPASSLEHSLFNQKYSLFVKSKEAIAKELSTQDSNKSLKLAFFGFIEKEGQQNLFERFKLLDTLVRKESDYIIADAGFLKKFLKGKNINQNVIFLTGVAHQEALSKDFEALGYNTIASERVGEKINDTLWSYYFRPEFLPSVLYALAYCTSLGHEQIRLKEKLLSLCPPKQEASVQVSSSNTTIARICGYCKKPEEKSKNLLRCGKCKKAWYCNLDCQRAAWPEHKKVCQ